MARPPMMFSMSKFLFLVLFGSLLLERGRAADATFDQNYNVTYGFDHILRLNSGTEIQISMDQTTGAGFVSKSYYGSGYFEMDIKVPGRDSAGVVTAFYLISEGGNEKHDEIDFEFLGNRPGKPYVLQTNVYAAGIGGREQQFQLWFDPAADFHNYRVLWNDHQVVFYVDGTPIRVYKNNTNIGARYITQPLKIQGSLWNGDDWATNGGKEKINWAYAPFQAHFRKFNVIGCKSKHGKMEPCLSSRYWWTREKFWNLDGVRQRGYDNVRKNFMRYDYCSDRARYPVPPPECIH